MLFGSPVAGAGVGIDNIAFMSRFLCSGGDILPALEKGVIDALNGAVPNRIGYLAFIKCSNIIIFRACIRLSSMPIFILTAMFTKS